MLKLKKDYLMADRWYNDRRKEFKPHLLTIRTKIQLYKENLCSILLYKCNYWTLTGDQENKLNTFERKILKSNFGLIL